MSELKAALAMENEIFKAVDFNFGYDSTMSNIATAIKAIVSNQKNNYVIGGKVTPYSSGGLNVSIAPIFVFCESSGEVVVQTKTTEPISFEEADSSLSRIDIIEVQGIETEYDKASRRFVDPSTSIESVATVATKKKIALNVQVKKGEYGTNLAPTVDSGFVKLAEVKINAGTNNITSEMIENISAKESGLENENWTNEKTAVFNTGMITEIIHTLFVSLDENGFLKDKIVKNNQIDFGTGQDQVKGTLIPAGLSSNIHGEQFTSAKSLTELILKLAENVTYLYKYANDIFSRYEFLEIAPLVCSTANVNITVGGTQLIDGVAVTEGQCVFLKDQLDATENGLYEVKSGSWTRYDGFVDGTKFIHKLVFVQKGSVNAGKVFYLNDTIGEIGTDELNFTESNFTSEALAQKFMIRDDTANVKVSEPTEKQHVTTKNYVDTIKTNLQTQIDAIKAVQDVAFDTVYPVGYVYIQFPNKSAPQTRFKKGTWRNISSSYYGAFFRAEDTVSTNKMASSFNGGRQTDSAPNIKGSFTIDDQATIYGGAPDGAFYADPVDMLPYDADSDSAWHGTKLRIDTSRLRYNGRQVYGIRAEVAPQNYTIRIWKRTA